ncbi:MAG: YfcE family phosphodiesterase [Deltaproteobacteria bacterium]|nr:YfcE family phosphodiesterase [Deltaproteobacteria bacterium]
MKIAIISDIHDNVWNLEAALERVQDAQALICCGDLCSPFIVDLMADGFQNQIHMVFGNNDGDQYRITKNAVKYNGRVIIHGEFADLNLGGKRFAVNHYPDIARSIGHSEVYDVVCYGHNHVYKVEQGKNTLLINPGAIMGYDGVSKKDIRSTFVVYDTDSAEWRGYEVRSKDNTLAEAKVVVEFKRKA